MALPAFVILAIKQVALDAIKAKFGENLPDDYQISALVEDMENLEHEVNASVVKNLGVYAQLTKLATIQDSRIKTLEDKLKKQHVPVDVYKLKYNKLCFAEVCNEMLTTLCEAHVPKSELDKYKELRSSASEFYGILTPVSVFTELENIPEPVEETTPKEEGTPEVEKETPNESV